MPKFSVTFEVVTHESAEHGDAAERGYIDQDIGLREAIGHMNGACEASDSHIQPGTWFAEIDGRECYRTGARTYHSLHPPRTVTQSSVRRIARLLGIKVRP